MADSYLNSLLGDKEEILLGEVDLRLLEDTRRNWPCSFTFRICRNWRRQSGGTVICRHWLSRDATPALRVPWSHSRP